MWPLLQDHHRRKPICWKPPKLFQPNTTCCPGGARCCAPCPAGRTPCACSTCSTPGRRRGASGWRPPTTTTTCAGPNPTGTPPLWRSGAPGRTSPASLARATWPMRPGPGAWGWRRPPARCAMNSCGGRRTPWAVDASPPPTAPTTIWRPCCSTWCGVRGSTDWRVSRPGGEWWCAPCSPPPGRRLWPTWRPTAWPTWRTAATPTRATPATASAARWCRCCVSSIPASLRAPRRPWATCAPTTTI